MDGQSCNLWRNFFNVILHVQIGSHLRFFFKDLMVRNQINPRFGHNSSFLNFQMENASLKIDIFIPKFWDSPKITTPIMFFTSKWLGLFSCSPSLHRLSCPNLGYEPKVKSCHTLYQIQWKVVPPLHIKFKLFC
jgi:hypothetical protein